MKDDTKVVLDSGFQALDSGFHSLAEFWIPWADIMDSKPGIPDFISRNFPDSGILTTLHRETRNESCALSDISFSA